MSRQRFGILFAVAAGVALASLPSVFAADFVIMKPDEIKYHAERERQRPRHRGDLRRSAEGGFYIIRARFKPGVMSRPHTHPTDRHVTVISGTWWAGTGKTFDPSKTTPLAAGSYMLHPANEPHFDGAKDVEAIVEIKGIGPAPNVPVPQ